MLNFIDRAEVSSPPRRTADGYLVADVKCARTGVQLYLGDEVGMPDKAVVRVYRPEKEVFAEDSLRTYAHRPVTDGHPKEPVSAKNWKQLAKGQTGSEIVRDGQFVRVPMILMDADSVASYESGGAREISMGYSAEIVIEDGKTPDGEEYDAYLRNIRINHLARVPDARGGKELRIGDWRAPASDVQRETPIKEKIMTDVKTQTVLVDGLSVLTTDAGAQAIAKLQKDIADGKSAHAAQIADLNKALAAKDADLAKKDAQIDSLNGKVLNDADLDKRVAARADLLTVAKSIADGDYTGKSDAEIKRAVVVAKLGDAAIAGKADAYVEARFDILADEAKKDPVRRVIGDRKTIDGNDNGQSAYETRLQDAWKAKA